MGFKLWGYAKGQRDATELAEITLIANPAHLRKIAAFILRAAEGIEQRGKNWEHEHLADKVKGFRTSPGFIVFNQQHEKGK